jgi:hypothetical protein
MEKQVDTDAETGKKTAGGARQCPIENSRTIRPAKTFDEAREQATLLVS